MQEMDDIALLREYTEHDSEEAFTTLVTRHVNLVYSTALRQVGHSHPAEEITQAVFVILARKARHLRQGTVVSGWLYHAARLTAANFLRSEAQRTRREQEAHMQSTLNEAETDVWIQIRPLLDSAMAGLSERDRNAVVLRFFEGRNMREVGRAIGASEEAAKKRVNRAVERLRKFFTRRGITLSAAVIAGAVSANSVQAAPAGLAVTVAGAAAKGSAVTASTLILVQGVLKVMAWTKAKTAVAVAAAVLLTAGTTVLTIKAVQAWRAAAVPDIRGAWEGVVVVPMGPEKVTLHAVLKISRANGTYSGTLDGVERGVKDMAPYRFDYNYPHLRVELIKDNSVFEGTVNTNTMEISGVYREPGLQLPVLLKRTDSPTPVPDVLKPRQYARRPDSELQGLWKGVLNVPGRSIHLNFKMAEVATGIFRGEMDNLDGDRGQWLTVKYQPPSLKLIVNSGAGMFQGQWDNSRTKFVGRWIEGRAILPLTIERAVPLYQPITDTEPEVTARVRSLKLEKLTAQDCTTEFWQQLQKERQSENPEWTKGVLAALGELQTVTLVERTNDAGRPSYLYRMEYANMNLLIRVVLDGTKIAYAKGYPEPE